MTDRTTPASPPARLRRIATAAGAGQPLPAEDARWLAEALGRYLAEASAGMTLDAALDVASRPGPNGCWWRVEARARRDELIRKMAARFFVGATDPAVAIADAARRYESTSWPRDSRRNEPPPGSEGTLREHMWRAFKVADKFPTSPRQIRAILDRTGNHDGVLTSEIAS